VTSEPGYGSILSIENVPVVLIEAYIDESGTGDSDPVYCLAGYLLRPGHHVEMSRKWKRELDRYELNYFHMTDCANFQHCEPYKTLGRAKCTTLATSLIGIIKQHCLQGFAVCFSPRFYTPYKDQNIQSQNPYAYSVTIVQYEVQRLIKQIGHKGSVNYIFEAGHSNQKQARLVLDKLHDDAKKEEFVFGSSFQNKLEAPLLQSADILAWHCQKYVKRKMNGQIVRADFRSLLRLPHHIYHFANDFDGAGLKRPQTTKIVLDEYPADDSPLIENFIKAVYLFDRPEPR
jgi:hypothetical protein